jgi:hypothetical protein
MTGSCLYGRVAFEIDGPCTAMELCHCSRCRKAYGSAFAATFYVKRSQIRWARGEELATVYDAPMLEKPPAYRHVFCRVCGSSLPIMRHDIGIAEIPAALVDGDPGRRPAIHIFTGTGAPWFTITDTLPRFEKDARASHDPITSLLQE